MCFIFTDSITLFHSLACLVTDGVPNYVPLINANLICTSATKSNCSGNDACLNIDFIVSHTKVVMELVDLSKKFIPGIAAYLHMHINVKEVVDCSRTYNI